MTEMQKPLVDIKNVVKRFPVKGGVFGREIAAVQAVSDVSLQIFQGETLGLVGESGCGKSTLGRCIIQLLRPTDGNIFFKQEDLTRLSSRQLRPIRRHMQMIFQDPFSSLNPRMTVEEIVGEPLDIHKICQTRGERRQKILELLEFCGLRKESMSRFPHEFSGGQRQRISIARAIAVKPDFIVCDEPVSALDVSIQSQIINLMQDLQKEFGLTYLFIAHDLKVVEHISTRVAVMYLGKIVELAESEELYQRPQHPYTKALMSAIPQVDIDKRQKRVVLGGDVPSPMNPPKGCHFHPRCPIAQEKCKQIAPELSQIADAGSKHLVSCHFPG